jgi:hypothetical protein
MSSGETHEVLWSLIHGWVPCNGTETVNGHLAVDASPEDGLPARFHLGRWRKSTLMMGRLLSEVSPK